MPWKKILDTNLSWKIFSALNLWNLNFSSTWECLHFTWRITDTITVSHTNENVGKYTDNTWSQLSAAETILEILKRKGYWISKKVWNSADLSYVSVLDLILFPPKPIHQSVFIKPWANKAQSNDDCVIQECVTALQKHCHRHCLPFQ